MKNDECTVYIGTRRERTWTYRSDKKGWTQAGPTGRVHRMTAEQLLSHLLPPLAGCSPAVVRVEPDRPRKQRGRLAGGRGKPPGERPGRPGLPGPNDG